ncbi:MAG: enoyl-CoA hydratase/isomerase family protein [Chloroflexota bacterium]|nr:enoyl-CoA hydratase/isomerase family protein [Chloroflexota bacterium]MDE3192427.1 enoyl-CoA hydratase/isomerase family protein [Chloroflexota bacterium]
MTAVRYRPGRIARITLDRPSVLNAADEAWVADLNACADAAAVDPAARVVVVEGAGTSFCSGIDLNVLAAGRIGRSWFEGWERAMRVLETMDKLVVAAIHGYCIGGGLQVALACDVRVARDDAVLGLPAVKEGLIPGLGVWRLPRFVGLGRARRMVLTGEVVGAREALAIGLVDEVATAEGFAAAVEARAEQLAGVAFASAIEAKHLLDGAFGPYAAALDAYLAAQERALAAPDHAAAMAAWRSRRAT